MSRQVHPTYCVLGHIFSRSHTKNILQNLLSIFYYSKGNMLHIRLVGCRWRHYHFFFSKWSHLSSSSFLQIIYFPSPNFFRISSPFFYYSGQNVHSTRNVFKIYLEMCNSGGAFFAWRAPIVIWPRIMCSQVPMLKFLEPSREMP